MKKYFLIGLFGCLATTLPAVFLHAQDQNLLADSRFRRNKINTAYTTGTAYTFPHKNVKLYVKAKVMRTFLRSFDNVNDVLWSFNNNRYLAGFTKEGRACRALFDTDGRLIYTIHSGTEKTLPPDVRKLIKSTYIDYTIGPVSEVDTNKIKAWIANLEDGDHLIVVRVIDGALDEMRRYKTHF